MKNSKMDLGKQICALFEERSVATVALPFMERREVGEARLPKAKQRRRKLWQLEDKCHCPVVGTCVPMDDLVQLTRRFGFLADRRHEYSLHVEAVAKARDKTDFSEALHKYLDRRYQAAIREFDSVASDGEIRTLWQTHLAGGNVAGAFWAVMTHGLASSDTRDDAIGDVHMLSHQVGAGQTADVRRMAALADKVEGLKRQLMQLRETQGQREAYWQGRQEDWERMGRPDPAKERELLDLRDKLAAYESGTVMVDMGRRLMQLGTLNEQLTVMAARTTQQQKTIVDLQQQLTRMDRERAELAAEREALEKLLLTEMNEATSPCTAVCRVDKSLAERRVLCVGGRTQLRSHYRQLAERLGIKLVHHDGGLEESLSRLPDMINGADMVVCPTDCVSHPAYYRIKAQCKRQGKPCLLFKGAGVSSFAAALIRLQETAGPQGAGVQRSDAG